MSLDSEQQAFEELFRTLEPEAKSVAEGFKRCRHKLVKFFIWRRCPDPEDLADETITRLVKKAGTEISAEKPYSFVYAIAANVFREYSRRKRDHGEVASIDEILEIPDHSRNPVDDCQKHCLDRLAEDKRKLLHHYYVDNISCEDIAKERQETINALRLKIFRIKEWLRRCCEDCRNRSSKGN
jgi:RNA polymerase sigma factor (sigma-70 family)